MNTLLKSIALAVLLGLSGCGSNEQREPVSSLTAQSTGTFYFSNHAGDVLDGTLRLPTGSGPFPIVIIMHGGSGVATTDHDEAKDLIKQGYATAVIDSFSGRHYAPTPGKGAGVMVRPFVRVDDAYAALNILSTHPRINASRSVLLGRSHGGVVTLLASTAHARQMFAKNNLSFTGFIALYPHCGVSYPEFEQPLAAPLKLHLAGADDLTPAQPCVKAAQKMKKLGLDVSYTLYPGALHGFDMEYPHMYLPEYDNYGKCTFKLPSIDAPLPSNSTLATCLTTGATIGHDETATKHYVQNRNAQLTELLMR